MCENQMQVRDKFIHSKWGKSILALRKTETHANLKDKRKQNERIDYSGVHYVKVKNERFTMSV